MTLSNIPSGFSSDDLERLLENAVSENEISDDRTDMSEERIANLASKICDDANELASGPLLHKVVALTILSRLIAWHSQIGENRHESGDIAGGTAWLRDAGQLQAAAIILQGVCLGPDDFTVHVD